MIRLPQGVPVRQNVNPARINLPEAMGKLRGSHFSGYLHFTASQGDGVVLFQSGQLISSLFVSADQQTKLIAYDAIARIFELSIGGFFTLNIYRISDELSPYLHALLHGRYLQQGKELKNLNIRSLLDYLKDNGTTACLRVYNPERCSLIFYDFGYPLGFFHERGKELEFSADLSQSVALDPACLIDVLEIQSADQLILADLMASADLYPIWQRVRASLLEVQNAKEKEIVASTQQQTERQKQYILNTLKTIGGTYLGPFGAAQVEKAFSSIEGSVNHDGMEQFYLELQRSARLVASQSKISEMIDDMRAKVNVDR